MNAQTVRHPRFAMRELKQGTLDGYRRNQKGYDDLDLILGSSRWHEVQGYVALPPYRSEVGTYAP